MAVIILWAPNADRNRNNPTVYGPFPSGQAASAWADRTLGVAADWYWMPLTIPAYAS